jgi:hypothetical protein
MPAANKQKGIGLLVALAHMGVLMTNPMLG